MMKYGNVCLKSKLRLFVKIYQERLNNLILQFKIPEYFLGMGSCVTNKLSF